MDIFLPCLYSFLACIFFCFIFNIKWNRMITASIGGALGWFTFLVLAGDIGNIYKFFIATVIISIYSEIMARIHKAPVTVFLIIAILPLVPGGDIYYTMLYCIRGDTSAFIQRGLYTLAIAGAMALGILFVSSLVRLWTTVFMRIPKNINIIKNGKPPDHGGF